MQRKSWLTVSKKRSIRPRPRGWPAVEKTRRIVQVGGDLLEVAGGEVGAVVGVEDGGDAADVPVGIGLAPDRLAQGQRRLQRRGRREAQAVAGHGAAVVVEDDRQPGPGRAVALVADPDVELGVVGLPDRVGRVGLAAVDQVEALAVGLRAVVGEA